MHKNLTLHKIERREIHKQRQIGYLPRGLSTEGAPSFYGPAAGDLSY